MDDRKNWRERFMTYRVCSTRQGNQQKLKNTPTCRRFKEDSGNHVKENLPRIYHQEGQTENTQVQITELVSTQPPITELDHQVNDRFGNLTTQIVVIKVYCINKIWNLKKETNKLKIGIDQNTYHSKEKANIGKTYYTKLNCFRSSHWRCSLRKDVLRNFAKFTGKHLCQSLFLNKVAG